MAQTVEDAKNLRTASQACHLKEANIRTPCRKLAERKSSWPGFGSCRSSTPRHPSQSLRSLFCKQKKIYERQAKLAIRSFSEGWWTLQDSNL